MKSLVFLSVLGLCGSVATALAIGLATSAKPQTTVPPELSRVQPAPANRPVDLEAGKVSGTDSKMLPAVETADPVAPLPRPPATSAPAVAAEQSATAKAFSRRPHFPEKDPSPQDAKAPGAKQQSPVAAVDPAPSPPESGIVRSATASEAPVREAADQDAGRRAAEEIAMAPRVSFKVREPADSAANLPSPPGKPTVVQPSERVLQQLPPELNQESLKQIYKILAGQAESKSDKSSRATAPAGQSPLPEIAAPAQSLRSSPASHSPEPVPTPPAQKPRGQISSAINEEGDQRLQIFFPETDIREILDSLSAQGNLNILASKNVQGKLSLRLTNVDVEGALEAVLKATGLASRRDGQFIYVGTPEEFNSMEQSVDRVGTRVYRPNYVTAAELQALIQPLMTDRVGVVSVSSPAEAGIATDAASAGGNKFAGGDVVLVRDYEAVLTQVDQVVAEVDVRPMQIAIEAMILSVKLNDTDTLGVNWEFFRTNNHVRLALGLPDSALPTKFTGGLQFAFLDANLGAFIDALQEYNETDVIATPRIMVLNKQRAEIQIGRQQGYVTSTTTETATTQTVQMMDTGTILRLRPFASSDGVVRVEVHPELSTGEVVEKGDVLVPDKEITQVTTNVMVRDGCTVILGGLFRDEVTNDVNQVPVLGSLPVVGALFRNRTDKTTRHEILVLLTPHIIYEPDSCQEGEKAACEFHRRQAVVTEKASAWNRHNIARKYLRLAQNAWAAGDRQQALRFAEMAVQFDPQFRAAIDLRANIWQNVPSGEHSLQSPCPQPAGHPLDDKQIPDWVLEDLDRGPAGPPAIDHPLDPGRPGTHHDIVRPRKLP